MVYITGADIQKNGPMHDVTVGIEYGTKIIRAKAKSIGFISGMVDVWLEPEGRCVMRRVIDFDASGAEVSSDGPLETFKPSPPPEEERPKKKVLKKVVNKGQVKPATPNSAEFAEIIFERLQAKPVGTKMAKKDLSSGLAPAEWKEGIDALLESGRIIRTGKKRGTKYHIEA